MSWTGLWITAVLWTAFCAAIAVQGPVVGALIGGGFMALIIVGRWSLERPLRRRSGNEGKPCDTPPSNRGTPSARS